MAWWEDEWGSDVDEWMAGTPSYYGDAYPGGYSDPGPQDPLRAIGALAPRYQEDDPSQFPRHATLGGSFVVPSLQYPADQPMPDYTENPFLDYPAGGPAPDYTEFATRPHMGETTERGSLAADRARQFGGVSMPGGAKLSPSGLAAPGSPMQKRIMREVQQEWFRTHAPQQYQTREEFLAAIQDSGMLDVDDPKNIMRPTVSRMVRSTVTGEMVPVEIPGREKNMAKALREIYGISTKPDAKDVAGRAMGAARKKGRQINKAAFDEVMNQFGGDFAAYDRWHTKLKETQPDMVVTNWEQARDALRLLKAGGQDSEDESGMGAQGEVDPFSRLLSTEVMQEQRWSPEQKDFSAQTEDFQEMMDAGTDYEEALMTSGLDDIRDRLISFIHARSTGASKRDALAGAGLQPFHLRFSQRLPDVRELTRQSQRGELGAGPGMGGQATIEELMGLEMAPQGAPEAGLGPEPQEEPWMEFGPRSIEPVDPEMEFGPRQMVELGTPTIRGKSTPEQMDFASQASDFKQMMDAGTDYEEALVATGLDDIRDRFFTFIHAQSMGSSKEEAMAQAGLEPYHMKLWQHLPDVQEWVREAGSSLTQRAQPGWMEDLPLEPLARRKQRQRKKVKRKRGNKPRNSREEYFNMARGGIPEL